MANETKISDLIIPEVMADMVRQELPHKLVFGPLLKIDNRLEGIPGNTLTVPKWGLIGIAEDVAELGAIPYEKLTTSKTTMTIKKVGKGVQFSDEALLSGYGDPLGEGTAQLALSVARKIDADVFIDDRNLGGFPGWGEVYEIITQKIEFGISNGEVQAYSKLKKERKKGWFW